MLKEINQYLADLNDPEKVKSITKIDLSAVSIEADDPQELETKKQALIATLTKLNNDGYATHTVTTLRLTGFRLTSADLLYLSQEKVNFNFTNIPAEAFSNFELRTGIMCTTTPVKKRSASSPLNTATPPKNKKNPPSLLIPEKADPTPPTANDHKPK